MAKLSDDELLFLSNLMHMKKEKVIGGTSPFKDIWSNNNKGKTIGELINSIDTSKLRKEPYCNKNFDGEISGKEWADMIDKIRKHDQIVNMKLKDVNIDDHKALSVYLEDKDGKPYVVFRGTSAGEWPDNFEGAYVSDTEQEKRALDYINSIGRSDITVVGHSKGGNKAKYVALLSDKVSRCVSFDGQGFSKYFIDKYSDLIEKNKHKITCYALDNDFVNILLYDIYGVKYYVKGNGVESFGQNHSPNSFYFFDENGYKIVITKQNEAMAKLHKFVNYVAATISESDREGFFNMLGDLAAMALGKKPPNYTEKYTQEEMIQFLLKPENKHYLGLLVAYLAEYEKYDNGITDVVLNVLEGTDLKNIAVWIRRFDKYIAKGESLEGLLDFIAKNRGLLAKIAKFLKAPNDIVDLIYNIADAYSEEKEKVPKVTKESLREYTSSKSSIVRDYSTDMRNALLDLTDEVKNEPFYDVTKWDVWYRLEDWFGLLSISRYKDNIDSYHRKVIDINGTTKRQLNKIFNEVDKVTNEYVTDMNSIKSDIKSIKTSIKKICN